MSRRTGKLQGSASPPVLSTANAAIGFSQWPPGSSGVLRNPLRIESPYQTRYNLRTSLSGAGETGLLGLRHTRGSTDVGLRLSGSTPVLKNLEEELYSLEDLPPLFGDDDYTRFFENKGSSSPLNLEDINLGNRLITSEIKTEFQNETNPALSVSSAKRPRAALTEEQRKDRNKVYSKRYREKAKERKTERDQYVAELESQCNLLRHQLEASNEKIKELEQRIETMNVMALNFAKLEQQVEIQNSTIQSLLLDKGIKQVPTTTTTSTVRIPDVSGGYLSSSMAPGTGIETCDDWKTIGTSRTTQGFTYHGRT